MLTTCKQVKEKLMTFHEKKRVYLCITTNLVYFAVNFYSVYIEIFSLTFFLTFN